MIVVCGLSSRGSSGRKESDSEEPRYEEEMLDAIVASSTSVRGCLRYVPEHGGAVPVVIVPVEVVTAAVAVEVGSV